MEESDELSKKARPIENDVTEIGENVTTFESLGYFLLSCSFLMFYLGTIGLNLNTYIIISMLLAAWCFKVAWERTSRNMERNLKAGPGYSERLTKWVMRKIGMTIYPSEWGVMIRGGKWEIRYIGTKVYQVFIIIGLISAFQQDNLRPLLIFSMWGSVIYIICRVLAGIPRPKLRMIIRGILGVLVAVIVVIPTMAIMPYYVNAYAKIPESELGAGWALVGYENIEMGMGLVQISFSFYFDQESEEEGYMAFLSVISAKIPEEASEELVKTIDDEMRNGIEEEEITLTENITNQSRKTNQGYNTTYSIYDGTADGNEIEQGGLSYPVTEGTELRYIMESWRVEETNLLVIVTGLAVIKQNEPSTGSDILDEALGINQPDMTNWEEVWNLGTEVVCYQE